MKQVPLFAVLLSTGLLAACTTEGDTSSPTPALVELNGVPMRPADEPCVNGRPEEVGRLDADDDIYVDDRLLDWPAVQPADADLDGVLLEQAAMEAGRAPKVSSLLVARHGQLVFERYFHGTEPTYAFNLHSVTKSLLGLLVGLAIEDGHLDGLDVPIGEVLPDVTAGTDIAGVTVGELLSMSAGVEWRDETSRSLGDSLVDAVVHADRIAEPGTVWEYNSGGSELVALALDRIVPGGLCRYAHERLFAPLGIDVDHWHVNPEAHVSGSQDSFMTPRELARVGQMVLDGGVWNGEQLVSAGWLETMLAPRFDLGGPPGLAISYGLHWWLHQVAGQQVWTAAGYGGQWLHLFPALDLVVVLTHDSAYDLQRQVPWTDLVRLFLLPAVHDTVIDPCPCPSDLFRARPDGSDREALAAHPANDVGGDWSPDGSQIAFHSFRDLNAELYVMNHDGTGLRRLTHDWAADAAPRWSPDGTRLAFLSDRSAETFEDIPVLDLHVIDLATGEVSLLTEGMGDVRGLDWAPNGERITYVRSQDRDGLGQLFAVDLESGSSELLFAGRVGFPSWSPDGTRIVVATAGAAEGDPYRISVLDLETGDLTDFGPGEVPSWSSNGHQVFATLAVDPGTALVVIDIDDGSRTVIEALPGGSPSPDYQWILFNDTKQDEPR